MVAWKPYNGPRKLVLAFDVGTTFSGVSYCILLPGQTPHIRDIHGVTKFPGQSEVGGDAKVPSVLYYDASGNVKAVGSQALDMEVNDEVEDGWTKAEWWKLRLRPKHLASTHVKDKDLPPLPQGRPDPVDILSDFIKYLYMGAKKYIEESGEVNWTSIENSVEFVFSHPNGWEGPEQQKYRTAIERAGLIPCTLEGRSRVHMITEGEASFHYCVATLSEERANSGPQAIVVIDAGGGTIDLSIYSATFKPIVCKEVAPAECRLQGSVFVTNRARDLIIRKLQGLSPPNIDHMDEIIRTFDQTTKLTIRSADNAVGIKIGNRSYNNLKLNITFGRLRLSGKEAAGLFDESIQAIIDAFEQQREVAKSKLEAAKAKITLAFLVGGLARNDLVWARLQSHFKMQSIDVYRPDNDINKAVANGAVIFHIDRVVKSRVARVTYGTSIFVFVDESNPEHRRRKDQWYRHLTGRYAIGGAFSPILRKGDQVDEEKEVRSTLLTVRKHGAGFDRVQAELLCYRGNLSDPQWLDGDPSSFTVLRTIEANMNEAAYAKPGVSGEVYFQVDFSVVAFFGSTEFKAQLAWKENGVERRTPKAIVKYDD